MRRAVVVLFLGLLVCCALGALGCSHQVPHAGQMVILQVPKDSNPDVIWVVREIQAQRKSGLSGTPTAMWGLFACYRSETPGEPTCYLAKISGSKESLVWPDDTSKYPFLSPTEPSTK